MNNTDDELEDELRALLDRVLSTQLNGLTAQVQKLSDSVSTLTKSCIELPKLPKKITELVEEELEQQFEVQTKSLTSNITKVGDRLHHVRDAFNIAVKLDGAALMHLNDAQRDADLAMRKRKSALNKYKKQQEKRKERLDKIGDEKSISNAAHEVRLEFEKNLKEMLPRLPAADDTSAMKKSYLRRFSLNFQTALWRCISRLDSLDSDNEYTSKILTFLIAELQEKENNGDAAFFFEEFIKKIDSPRFDNYWLLVPGPKFIADRAQLGSCMEKATIWLRECFAEACNRAVKVQKNALKQQQTRMRRGLQRVQARIEQLEGDGAAQQDAMVKQAKEIANLRSALAADRQRASEFDKILCAALRKDLRARRDAMVTETVPTKRFLQLIEAVTISYRFRERFTTLLASTEDLQ